MPSQCCKILRGRLSIHALVLVSTADTYRVDRFADLSQVTVELLRVSHSNGSLVEENKADD